MSPTIIIRENMRVLGSCGNYVGTVEQVEGDEIRLSRNHTKAGHQHHWVPLAWVASVDDFVHLDRVSDQAHREWRPSAVIAFA
jgi:hypothetical protein